MRQGKEESCGRVRYQAGSHGGQLVQGPVEERQGRAKSMPGVFYDCGARVIS